MPFPTSPSPRPQPGDEPISRNEVVAMVDEQIALAIEKHEDERHYDTNHSPPKPIFSDHPDAPWVRARAEADRRSARHVALLIVLWGLYISGGFLTAAHYHNRFVASYCERQAGGLGPTSVQPNCSPPRADLRGLVWPAYWAWKGALWVTR